MTVPPVGSSGTTQSSAAIGAQGSVLGENDFLKILVTQLQNQDPLNPMDGTAFVAQLAQFSSLEQLIQMNTKVDQQTNASGQAAAASQAALAASLIGRSVEAASDQVQIGDGATQSLTADIGGNGGAATLEILDAGGKVLSTRDLGAIQGGRQTLTWSNDVGGVPEVQPGVYTCKLTVTASDGSSQTVTTYASGTVDGVDMTSNGIVLRIGKISVPLGAVVTINPATAAPTPAASYLPIAWERTSS